MTSDSNKDVPDSILKDAQKTAAEAGQTQLDSKQISAPGEATLVAVQANSEQKILEKEVNGPKGLEPTRYGDWESKGRCYDF